MTNNKRKFAGTQAVLMLTFVIVGVVLIYSGYIVEDGWLGLVKGTVHLAVLVGVIYGLVALLNWARRRDARAAAQNEEIRGEDHLSAVMGELTAEERDAIRQASQRFPKPDNRAQDGS